MFKKGQNVDPKKGVVMQASGVGRREWGWVLAILLASGGVLGFALRWYLREAKPRKGHRKRSILIEPPQVVAMEGEEVDRNGGVGNHRLHVSHSAPSLLSQPHNGLWDVVIVGGGPSGATAAFYLAKAGVKVLIIEKDSFPRDKICGDQIQPHAQHILSDMGVMQSLLDEDVVKWTSTRGIVSPAGISFIGEMKEKDTLISVQRIVLDKKMMEAATREGAVLRENLTVKSAHLSRASRRNERRRYRNTDEPALAEGSSEEEEDEGIEGDYWTIQVVPTQTHTKSNASSSVGGDHSNHFGYSSLAEGGNHQQHQHQHDGFTHQHLETTPRYSKGEGVILARLMICAEGANAQVARNLTGLKPDESPSLLLGPPNAVGCRAFAKHRTHHCRADEVIFYTKEMLPGSFRMSSELEDFLNLTCFVLPSDDYNTSQLPLHAVHQFNNALTEPWINATLGPDRQLTSVRTAPMRVGGIHRTYFPHGVIVGDAAGHTDPLSGDGLQYGLRAAKMAAETLQRALNERNYSSSSMQRYESAWRAAFGWDFFWGRQIVYIMARFPILVDAVALVIQRHGMKAISFWALAKAGSKSKWELILWFLRPDVAWLMAFYSFNLWLRKRGFF
jgi:flavin-dependent dehydrogenase